MLIETSALLGLQRLVSGSSSLECGRLSTCQVLTYSNEYLYVSANMYEGDGLCNVCTHFVVFGFGYKEGDIMFIVE